MHNENPENLELVTYLHIIAWAGLGGAASFLNRVRTGEIKHGFVFEFLTDAVYSIFSGMVAFFVGHYFKLDEMAIAACVSMSGHLGARNIIKIEKIVIDKFISKI